MNADGRNSLMPIDWNRAAWLTASGARPSEILAEVHCSRSQLRRRQQTCGLFGALVEQYRLVLAELDIVDGKPGSQRRPAGDSQLLVETVREKLEQEIIDGNIKVAMWLAERLRLYSPEDREGTDGTLRRLLETMTEAEREAFRQRD